MSMNVPPPASAAASRVAQQAVSKGALEGKPAVLLLGALAAGMSWWMVTDRYESNKPREEQEASMYRVKQDLDYAHVDQNIRGGQNKMADLAKRFIGLKIYGPFGLNEDWEETKRKIHSVIREVIMPCTIPLAIGIASLYGYFGSRTINGQLGYACRKIGGVFFKPEYGANLGKYASKAFTGTVDGMAKLLTHAIKNPVITTGLLLLSAWFLKNFDDVYSGKEQHDFFFREFEPEEEMPD